MHPRMRGADGTNDITPWKVFYGDPGDLTDDIRKLFNVIEIPDRQQSLANIMQIGLKLAEDTTGLPLMLQGQNAKAPDTLGGLLLVDRNATGVLRRIARTFDDCITEPHIRRYYTFLLLYGPDDSEKGEFVIDAKGSTALVEREVNREEATGMLQASLNPAFGVDPKKAMREKLRADNRNPDDFLYSEQDQQKMAQQPQPQDPRIAAAQIKADSDAKIKAAELQVESAEKEKDRQLQLIVEQIAEHIWSMRLQGQQELSIEQLKAELAEKVMDLRTQDRLNQRSVQHATPQVATPPTEPVGRAPAGQAYAQ